MKKVLYLSAVAMLAMSAANAGLVDIYVGATGSAGESLTIMPEGFGASKMQSDANSFGAVIGADIPLVRVEAEYNYMTAKDISLSALMINGYLKAPFPLVKPYVGLGAGSTLGGKVRDDDAKTSSAFQGMAGVQVEIPATSIFLDIEGRVFYATKISELSLVVEDKDIGFLQYDVRMKLRYAF